MKKPLLPWRFIATLCLLLTFICSSIVHASPYAASSDDLGGFTPNAEVTISFAKSRYPISSTQKAEVSITGPTNGTYTIPITNAATGSEVASISLQIGGAPGSNQGSVDVTLPSTSGDVTYTATFGSATDDATVTAVSVSKIQYLSGSSYVDASGTMYVAKGTSVSFKAIPDPSGSWPSGNPVWGGSASGTSETASVTFNTVSTSSLNPSRVSVKCGNTIETQVVVYDLKAVSTPQDDFDFRSQKRYGVGEPVDLSFVATPSVATSEIEPYLEWTYTGSGTLTDNGNGNAFYVAGIVNGSVSLKLKITGGPSAGEEFVLDRTIVQPDDSSYMSPEPYIKHTQNTASVGFVGVSYLYPDDVSFKYIGVAEGTGTLAATGWFAAKGLNGAVHTPSGGSLGAVWIGVDGGKKNKGSKVLNFTPPYGDSVGFYMPQDSPPNAPYSVGDATWPIDWWYVTTNPATGLKNAPSKFLTANHYMNTTSTGKASTSKLNSPLISAEAADPTTTISGWAGGW